MINSVRNVLEVENLWAGYNKAEIIRGVSLSVAAGEVLGLAGRNGVGKTTLAKSVVGLVRGRQGEIRLGDTSVHGIAPFRRAMYGVGYVPQGRGIFDMSVQDNLRLGIHIGHRKNARLKQRNLNLVFAIFPVLKRYLHRNALSLSGGEQQMLSIARVLMGDPRLLILDEPSEGIQPSLVKEIGVTTVRLAKELGIGVILIEQNVDLLVGTSTRILVMEKGAIVAELRDVVASKAAEVASYLAL